MLGDTIRGASQPIPLSAHVTYNWYYILLSILYIYTNHHIVGNNWSDSVAKGKTTCLNILTLALGPSQSTRDLARFMNSAVSLIPLSIEQSKGKNNRSGVESTRLQPWATQITPLICVQAYVSYTCKSKFLEALNTFVGTYQVVPRCSKFLGCNYWVWYMSELLCRQALAVW